MEIMILFTYEGKNYSVDLEAYDLNLIILPDGRALEAETWLESYPPKPKDLREVNHIFKDLKPMEIANKLNGALAVQV